LIFGTSSVFLVEIPSDSEMSQAPDVDWEFAMKEIEQETSNKRKL
jgi:hypothetical protein